MKGFRAFHPDLIVEVTGVCDRACAGCYAPNLISKYSPEDLFREKPEMFLMSEGLNATLTEMKANIDSIALRGGEPSRHPYLSNLLRVAHKHSRNVYVETHGRWILNNGESELLQVCAELGTILKISFDRMHGLSSDELKGIINRISKEQAAFLIAITEATDEDFLKTRALCDWVPDENIIHQKKAKSLHELIEPRIGVVKLSGKLARTLTTKRDFVLKPIFAGLTT